MKSKTIFFILLFPLLAWSSEGWIDAGLPADVNFPFCEGRDRLVDASKIEVFLHAAQESDTSALIILRNGCLLVEKHYGSAHDEVFSIQSISKSIASLAIGQLLKEGRLNLETSMAQLFPNLNLSDEKAAITVRQLLNQTSGIPDWDKAPTLGRSALDRIFRAPLEFSPGTNFLYSSMAVYVLGSVIEAASGMGADKYVQENVLRPLGIQSATWGPYGSESNLENPVDLGGGIFMSSRDLLPLGQMILQNGKWKGSQVFDSRWIAESMNPSQDFFSGYGFLWWLYQPNIISAAGYQGQFITVVPDQNLVVVRIHRLEQTTDLARLQKIYLDVPGLLNQIGPF